jgi:hypothetical protein
MKLVKYVEIYDEDTDIILHGFDGIPGLGLMFVT